MGHVTFIHGIGNKPEPEVMLAQWRAALIDDEGVDLDALGVTSSAVYWADFLYGEYAPAAAANESSELELANSVSAEDADMTWLAEVPAAERNFVDSVAHDIGIAEVTPTPTEVPDPIIPGSPLEAVPLPWALKRRLMRVFLRDVHHYLFDAEFSPRPGTTHRIRRDVRARALDVLREGASRPGPHLVVAHSLGSVIAYDVLTAVDDAPSVDALLTVGSPLGISEVQDKLAPPWTRRDGWPSRRLADGPWTNVYDPWDPVCGAFDRKIAGDFQLAGVNRINDISVKNGGSWRHAIGKYLGQDRLRGAMRELFD